MQGTIHRFRDSSRQTFAVCLTVGDEREVMAVDPDATHDEEAARFCAWLSDRGAEDITHRVHDLAVEPQESREVMALWLGSTLARMPELIA